MSQPIATGSHREISEPGGVKILYEVGAILPASVRYQDGTSIEFLYDSELKPIYLRERSGATWKRVGQVGDDGLALWQSEAGLQERLAVAVQPSGSYQRMDSLRIVKSFNPSGRTYISYLFNRTFDLKEAAKSLFSAADTNVDKALTKIELDRAAAKRWGNEDDALFVQVLRASFEQLINMRDDPLMRDAGGLEFEEILKHSEKADRMVAATNVRYGSDVEALFGELFDVADQDKDGMICLDELPILQSSSLLTANQQSILNVLTGSAASIADFQPYGFADRSDQIFKPEFLKLGRAVYESFSKERMLPCGWLVEETMQRANRASIPLFSSDTVTESVTLQAVQQGPLGSSYLHAVLAGIVSSNPSAVSNMIKEGTAGMFTITFPGVSEPCTVELWHALEIGLNSRGIKYGAWSAVLNKAFDCVKASNPDAVAVMTNRPGQWHKIADLSDEDLKDKLVENFRQRRIVVCSPNLVPPTTPPKESFAIVRVNKDTGKVQFWNHSWSETTAYIFQHAEKGDENTFTVPIYELKKRFQAIYLV